MNLSIINKLLAGFIITMCLVLSGFMLFSDLMIDSIHGTKRSIFVVILLGYAAFRIYRLLKQRKET